MKVFGSKKPDAGKNPRGGKKAPAGNGGTIPSRVYRQLSSIKTSVYILGLLAVIYLLGTIFPQGGDIDEYINAGGRFVFFVRAFGLLGIFTSPFFLIVALVLLLNLVVCTYDRYKTLFIKKPAPPVGPGREIYLTQDLNEAQLETRKVLREELGFKLVSKDEPWVTMEKGLPYRWLTWLYHVGIVLCFVGFILTSLFAFEDVITLHPGKAAPIEPAEQSWLSELFGTGPKRPGISLMLDEFKTEYTTVPKLEYPSDKLMRLAIGLGWEEPEYKITLDSYYPREWSSRLRVYDGTELKKEKTIEINDPLKYGGYTFYQMGFEQFLKIRVDDNPIPLEVEAGHELMVPGLDDTIKFGSLRTGTLYRLDGGVENIAPFATVSRVVPDKGVGESGTGVKQKEFIELGRLELGGAVMVDGHRITFADFEETSVLSYRYDPGVPVLWWSGIFVLIMMCLRVYGGWYRASYMLTDTDGVVVLQLHITTKGLWANAGRVAERLEYFLTRDDIRPTPLQ